MGSSLRREAKAPLTYISPSQTGGKWGIKIYLFERGIKGMSVNIHPKSNLKILPRFDSHAPELIIFTVTAINSQL